MARHQTLLKVCQPPPKLMASSPRHVFLHLFKMIICFHNRIALFFFRFLTPHFSPQEGIALDDDDLLNASQLLAAKPVEADITDRVLFITVSYTVSFSNLIYP